MYLWGWDNQWYDEGDRMEPYKYADHVAAVSNGERHAAVINGNMLPIRLLNIEYLE